MYGEESKPAVYSHAYIRGDRCRDITLMCPDKIIDRKSSKTDQKVHLGTFTYY